MTDEPQLIDEAEECDEVGDSSPDRSLLVEMTQQRCETEVMVNHMELDGMDEEEKAQLLSFSQFKKIKLAKVHSSLLHPITSAKQKLKVMHKYSPVFAVPEIHSSQ